MNKNERNTQFCGILNIGKARYRYYRVSPLGMPRHFSDDVLHAIARRDRDCDYSYYDLGFLLVHIGRRGDNVVFFDIGSWGDTVEVFVEGYYKYTTEDFFHPLLQSDPIFSIYDFRLVSYELEQIQQTLEYRSILNDISQYIGAPSFNAK